MASMHHPNLSILVVSLLLLALHATATRPSLLHPHHDICEKTDFVQLCRKSVKGAENVDVASLNAMGALLVEINKRKEAIAKTGNNQLTRLCSRSYGDAVDNLKESMGYLKTHDIGSLMSYLSATLSSFSDCDSAYQEVGGKSPFAANNKFLEDMASNCLALASQIH
ncbi:hypothetical protein ACFE04_024636 [Oxalis oulophora]